MSDLRKRAVTMADADGTAPDVSELIYDLLDSAVGAKLMQERAADVCQDVAAIIQIDADRFRGGSNPHHERLFKAAIYRDAATTIRAIPAPTDAEVLAAAMELPQIKALKLIRDELDNLLDAITADDKFGDRSLTITGPTSNLKWLIEAQDDARSAIAAYADLVAL